jgi:hypothetical protein
MFNWQFSIQRLIQQYFKQTVTTISVVLPLSLHLLAESKGAREENTDPQRNSKTPSLGHRDTQNTTVQLLKLW